MDGATLPKGPAATAFLVAAALLLGGCPSVPEASPAPSPEPARDDSPAETVRVPRVGSSTRLEHSVAFPPLDRMPHLATKLVFPREAAGFHCTGGRRYDREGNDLSFLYRRVWKDNHALVTVYVYPRPFDRDTMEQESATEHLDRVLEPIYREHDDVVEVRRTGGPASLRGIPVTFAAAEHEHRGTDEFLFRRVTRATTVVAAQSWWIKTFATTARDHRAEALAAVEELLAALRLPPTGLPPGEE